MPLNPKQITREFLKNSLVKNKLIAADLVFLPPVAERDAAGVAELGYGVGRAASEPGERLDGLRPLLCAVHPYGPPVLFWSRISAAVPY